MEVLKAIFAILLFMSSLFLGFQDDLLNKNPGLWLGGLILGIAAIIYTGRILTILLKNN